MSAAGDLHRKWVVRYWMIGSTEAQNFQQFHVCDDEEKALAASRNYADLGFSTDAYQLLSPDHCPHCESETRRSGRCHCQNDE